MSDLYSITEQFHPNKGTYIYVVRLNIKVTRDELTALREYAKVYAGSYSNARGINGYVFPTEENAKEFGDVVDVMFSDESIDYNDPDLESFLPDVSASERVGADMPLHQALRHIILTDGQDIIADLSLVEILEDFGVYQSIPASKYILRAIIADGFSAQLLSIGEWNDTARKLVETFIRTTGFAPEYVETIFQALAYGLGWIKEPNPDQQPDFETGLIWHENNDDDEIDEYYKSITDYNSTNESRFKVALENLHYFIQYGSLILSCELRRRFRKAEFINLDYALYDKKGRVVESGMVAGIDLDNENPLPVTCNLTSTPTKISRIKLYWSKF